MFSKGKQDNKSVPRSAFSNQALHCDFQPEVANSNAKIRGRPVPYSIIINKSPEDVIIRGCGIYSLEVIDMTPAGQPMYEDLPVPVNISVPIGSMWCSVVIMFTAERPTQNNIRIFMDFHLDGKAVNTTSLQEEEKLPPCDINGESTAGEYEGNRAPRKRASKASKKGRQWNRPLVL